MDEYSASVILSIVSPDGRYFYQVWWIIAIGPPDYI